MFILDKDYENRQYLPPCHLKLMLCTLGSFESEMDPSKFASEWTSLWLGAERYLSQTYCCGEKLQPWISFFKNVFFQACDPLGGQKVRNLRLSLNKGVLVHLEDGSFFLFLTKAPDFKLTYPLQYQERPHISHSPSSLTRTHIRRGETVSDGLQRRMHLYNRPSFSSAFKTYTCAFSSRGEWGGRVLFLFTHFGGKSYKSILRQSGLLLYSQVFSPG